MIHKYSSRIKFQGCTPYYTVFSFLFTCQTCEIVLNLRDPICRRWGSYKPFQTRHGLIWGHAWITKTLGFVPCSSTHALCYKYSHFVYKHLLHWGYFFVYCLSCEMASIIASLRLVRYNVVTLSRLSY